MKLSLLLIYENLADKEITLKMEEAPGPRFDKIRILPEAHSQALEEDILYIDTNQRSDNYDAEELSAISLVAYANDSTSHIKNGLLVSQKTSVDFIFDAILEIFDRFRKWDDLLKRKLIEGENMQDIFNLCSMVTPDTVYITDVSMKMYVHSSPTLMEDISAIWRYQVSYGYMPINVMNRLITSGELEKIKSFRKAFSPNTQTFNLPYTCRNIFSGNTLKAHIFIISIYSKPTQTHKEIADELGDLITPFVCRSPYFASRAGQVYENFFQDLLKRRVTNTILIKQQIAIFDWNMNDTYALLVIDVKNQHMDRIQFLIDYFCNKRDCKAFENEKYIICIFHIASEKSKATFAQSMKSLLSKMNLKGAFSKNFVNICDMDIYYRQAADILQFCMKNEAKRVLFLQEDFGLYSIFNASLENHNAYELCHPDIITLYEFDQKNDTDYLETLYQYLLNDRNAVKAAKTLYIHRNTMTYRLEKLKTMLSFDEEDPVNRFYVLTSIFLLKYQLDKPEDANVG